MGAWWDGPLVGLDLETTGTDPEEARIVTAALVTVDPSAGTYDSRTWLADPGVPIPDEAAAVHGVTTERAQAEGRPAPEVVDEILVAMLAGGVAVRPLCITNARYDLTVLDRERARHGLDLLPLTEWERLRVVDPYVVDKHLDRYRKGSRKLDALCAHYGATLDDAHEAGADALAACRLAWALGSRGKVVRRVWNAQMGREKAALDREWESVRSDLSALHEAQRGWAREQAEGLREHFASTGQTEEAASVRVEWPVVEAHRPSAP